MLDAARLIAVGGAAYVCVALDRRSKRIATLAFTGRVWLPTPMCSPISLRSAELRWAVHWHWTTTRRERLKLVRLTLQPKQ